MCCRYRTSKRYTDMCQEERLLKRDSPPSCRVSHRLERVSSCAFWTWSKGDKERHAKPIEANHGRPSPVLSASQMSPYWQDELAWRVRPAHLQLNYRQVLRSQVKKPESPESGAQFYPAGLVQRLARSNEGIVEQALVEQRATYLEPNPKSVDTGMWQAEQSRALWREIASAMRTLWTSYREPKLSSHRTCFLVSHANFCLLGSYAEALKKCAACSGAVLPAPSVRSRSDFWKRLFPKG